MAMDSVVLQNQGEEGYLGQSGLLKPRGSGGARFHLTRKLEASTKGLFLIENKKFDQRQ